MTALIGFKVSGIFANPAIPPIR